MSNPTSEIVNHAPQESSSESITVFSAGGFEVAQRMAKALAASTLVPEQFRGSVPNCLIALEISNRLKASALMVMQNLYIVHGRPAWSAQWVTASVNTTGRFSPLRFKMEGSGEDYGCTAWAVEKGTNERLEGPKVTLKMAKDEGWSSKSGSKWKTMPELMLRYRAATFFGRLYAPEVLMGMHEQTEVEDIGAKPANAREVRPALDLSAPASPAPSSARLDNETAITDACDAAGVTVADFIPVAVTQGIIERRATLADCTDAEVKALAENAERSLKGGGL